MSTCGSEATTYTLLPGYVQNLDTHGRLVMKLTASLVLEDRHDSRIYRADNRHGGESATRE